MATPKKNTDAVISPLDTMRETFINAIAIITAEAPNDFQGRMILQGICQQSHYWLGIQSKAASELADKVRDIHTEMTEAREAGQDHGTPTELDHLEVNFNNKVDDVDFWEQLYTAAQDIHLRTEGKAWEPRKPTEVREIKPKDAKAIKANLDRFK